MMQLNLRQSTPATTRAEDEASVRATLRCQLQWALFKLQFLLSGAVTVLVILLDATVDGSTVWHGQGKVEDPHWCEKVVSLDRFVRTPMNGYSALAFAFSGFAIMSIVYYEPRESATLNHLRHWRSLSAVYGASLVYGAAGSLWNHAAVTRYSREPDRASIWSMTFAPLFLAALRYAACPASEHVYYGWIIVLLAANLVASVGHLAFGESSLATPMVYIGVPCVGLLTLLLLCVRPCLVSLCGLQPLQLSCKGGARLFAGLILVVLGVLLQDPRRVGACDPAGPWWKKTHAYWHICIAAALFLFWFALWDEAVVEGAQHGHHAPIDKQGDPEDSTWHRESGIAL